MNETETDFWIAVSLWGGSAITVLGTGLYALVEGLLWSGGSLTVLGLVLVMYIAQHLKGKRLTLRHALIGALILTWIFFGYDIYNRQQTRPPVFDSLFTHWDTDGTACNATINGSKIIDRQDKYRVALICGFLDPTVDYLNDSRITITKGMNIHGGFIVFSADYSEEMADGLAANIRKSQAKKPPLPSPLPPGFGIETRWSTWYAAVLLPKDVDTSEIHSLSDVTERGGTILQDETQNVGIQTNGNSN
jgi:hypothetical protein